MQLHAAGMLVSATFQHVGYISAAPPTPSLPWVGLAAGTLLGGTLLTGFLFWRSRKKTTWESKETEDDHSEERVFTHSVPREIVLTTSIFLAFIWIVYLVAANIGAVGWILLLAFAASTPFWACWCKPSFHTKFQVLPRWGMRTVLGMVFAVFVLLVTTGAVFYPAPRPHMQAARRAVCLSNVRQIGLALIMYSQKHDGKIPEPTDIPRVLTEADYLSANKVFICLSASGERLADREGPPKRVDYEFISGGRLPDSQASGSENIFMVWDKADNHSGTHPGRNVGFCNGNVRWLAEEEFQETLKKQP